MDIVMSEQLVTITMPNEDGDDSDTGSHHEDDCHQQDCLDVQDMNRFRDIGVYLRQISQQFDQR